MPAGTQQNGIQTVACLPPTILYKYLPFRDSFFDRPVLRFTPPCEQNDPFEFHVLGIDYPEETLRDLHERHQDLDKISEQRILASIFYKAARKERDKHEYGILSLTEDCYHIAMWSHYADAHKGMVIGINPLHEDLKKMNNIHDPTEFITPVFYCSQPPSYSVKKEEPFERIKYTLGTKGLHWHYEKEWRILTNTYSTKEKIINEKGKEIGGFVDISPECIKIIILGLECTQEHIVQAKDFVSSNPHIALYLAYKSVGAYALDLITYQEALRLSLIRDG